MDIDILFAFGPPTSVACWASKVAKHPFYQKKPPANLPFTLCKEMKLTFNRAASTKRRKVIALTGLRWALPMS
jgi:hypothetical protein